MPGANTSKPLSKYPEKFLQCRDRHKWDNLGYSGGPDKKRAVVQTFHCERCDTYAYRYLDPQGEIVGTSMDYPEGYLLPGSGVTQKNVRKELLHRHVRA